MAPQKRARDDLTSSASLLRAEKSKKAKRSHEPGSYSTQAAVPAGKKVKFGSDGKAKDVSEPATTVVAEEVDFPRGGGVSLERLNAGVERMEVDGDVLQDGPKKPRTKKQSVGGIKDRKRGRKDEAATSKSKNETIRVEHLNYKRLEPGQKLLGQITSILPLALIISLPNQLMGHVPIVNISPQLTSRLDSAPSRSSRSSSPSSEDEGEGDDIPSLTQLFSPGQYVACTVKQVRPPSGSIDFGARPQDESEKAAKKVELSIRPGDVNAGVGAGDIRVGFNISGAIKSIEDHGYTVDFGLADISGFVPSKNITNKRRFTVGQVVSTTVTNISETKRLATLSVKFEDVRDAALAEATSAHALLPGTLVSALATAIVPSGLNVQILGFFNGTIELFHLPGGTENFKIGDKVKARVLWDIPGSSPPRFALSLLPHVINLVPASTLPPPLLASEGEPKKKRKKEIEAGVKLAEAYPIGMILESVRVTRVESEWGLVCQIGEGVDGFVHISQIADSLVPQLSSTSGTWRVGSTHRARVTGHHALDGLVLLSLQPSLLELVYMQAGDVSAGETVKGTIKKLKEKGLVVALSDKVTGFVGPDHYADIRLKHPERKFKEGATVLSVDADRSRVRLTLKKSLLESTLPILTSFEDAKVGMVTPGVVQRVEERFVILEYYGGVRALVPLNELTDTQVSSTAGLFIVGQVVKSRITAVDRDAHKITASIRQAAPSFQAPADVSSVQVGSTVSGTLTAVHDENAVLSLDEPEGAIALVSLSNLANARETTVSQLRASIEKGERVEDVTVISVNPDKALVIVSAAKPKPKPKPRPISSALRIDALKEGQVVSGRVGATMANGTGVRLSKYVVGRLHSTDLSDDFTSPHVVPPTEGKILDVAIVRVDKNLKRVDVSLRKSRLEPQAGHQVADREVGGVEDMKVGEAVRGFVKSVVQHGVFVSLGRDVTARIQIKELFDEYVKDWQSRFSAGQVISARVLSLNVSTNQVELTMRSGDISKLLKHTVGLSDFEVGQKVEGRVKGVTDFGLFIEIAGTKISGLCHKSEVSDNKKANIGEALKSFREDDVVKAVILSIDATKRKISFGIKPSYFADEDFEMNAVDNEASGEGSEEGSEGDALEDSEGEEEQSGNGGEASDDEGENEDSDEGSEADSEDEVADAVVPDEFMADSEPATQLDNAPALALNGGFSWTAPNRDSHEADPPLSDDPGSDSEGETSNPRKKKKKKAILQDLTADLHTKVPESTADFERVVLGSPNSSFLWVQYMSFQLQLSEVDKAREIGRRALQTINYREEQEKLNVWTALLNLENQFGTDESLEALFQDAARHNDSKTMYLRLAAILEESEKAQKAEEQLARTVKKFSQSSKVWTLFGEYYLKTGKLEEARKLLPRSLLSLPQRKHLKAISTFARMEYKLGDPERGKTIFEGIVESHPKRHDLWSVYIDMEASQNNIQSIRFFFKKWLELERRIGDDTGAEAVKDRAVTWMQYDNTRSEA
ncbi:rRNA biogenesis protein rrp5 [Ceratobasidium sp. 414]|nr:rRNA biogenesis protein rrp5 [Ceratobasidium sp. 414]